MQFLGDFDPGEVVHIRTEAADETTVVCTVNGIEVDIEAVVEPAGELQHIQVPLVEELTPPGAQVQIDVHIEGEDAITHRLYAVTVGRTYKRGDVVPSHEQAIVNANVVGAMGREWDKGGITRGTLESKIIGPGQLEDGVLTNSKFAPAAIQAKNIGPGAFSVETLSAEALNAFRVAVTGGDRALSTDDEGRVRLAVGDGAGEILLKDGAVSRVTQADNAPPPAPSAEAIAHTILGDEQAKDSLAGRLKRTATKDDLTNLPLVRAEDIVTGGPIQTAEGRIAAVDVVESVSTVKTVKRLTEPVSGVRGDVTGTVLGNAGLTVEAVAAALEGVLDEVVREPLGRGDLPADATFGDMLRWLYKLARNKQASKDGRRLVFSADGTQVDQRRDEYTQDGVAFEGAWHEGDGPAPGSE